MYPSHNLSYAPTPFSHTPYTSLSSTIPLDTELKLPTATAERDLIDSLAEIYSIIITLDALEKAFNKDSVTDTEYSDVCWRLIRQYKSNLTDERIAHEFGSLEAFKARWGIEAPRATERLRVMLPSTVEHATTSGPTASSMGAPARSSAHAGTPMGGAAASPAPQQQQGMGGGASVQQTIAATENFITFLDALKLGISSKDQLHPLLSEVITTVNKVTEADFEGRGNIIKWLIKLNQMRANQELEDADRREVEFEMEVAYKGFKKAVGG